MSIDLERLRQLVLDLQQKLEPQSPNNTLLRHSIADLLRRRRARRIVVSIPSEVVEAIVLYNHESVEKITHGKTMS